MCVCVLLTDYDIFLWLERLCCHAGMESTTDDESNELSAYMKYYMEAQVSCIILRYMRDGGVVDGFHLLPPDKLLKSQRIYSD